jgi:hypothetical protein
LKNWATGGSSGDVGIANGKGAVSLIILLNVPNSGLKLVGGFGHPPNTPHGSNNR